MSEDNTKPLAHVLIVEDDETQSLLIQEAMKNTWMEKGLHAVSNGKEAMSYLKKNNDQYKDAHRPDLIFMDLRMPGGDGIDMLQTLKKEEAFSSIPVIVFTASEKDEDVIRSYALGANCYIQKPKDLKKMEQVVKVINDFWFGIASLPSK